MESNREDNTILLSISLTVAHNKDTMKRTMESLKPLLQNIQSECILVDRGSTDGSMEIALEYTPNSISFPDGDLTAARNAGLKQARGQWFLYLEEGEWLEDSKEIINFFNSGKYEKFGHAIYFRRNLQSGKEGFYMDTPVAGACKIEESTHFEEGGLSPLHLPSKQWHGFVYHQGFTFQSAKEEQRYHSLYKAYLLRELKKKPDNLQNIIDLGEEYCIASEYRKGAEISRKAIESYKWKWSTKEGNYLMCALVRMLSRASEQQMVWEEGWQILNNCEPKPLTVIHICIYLIKSAQKLGGHEQEILELALEYCRTLEYLQSRPEEWQEAEMLSMTFLEAKRLQKMVKLTGIMACCRLGEYDNFSVFLENLPWEDGKEMPTIMEECKRAFPSSASALTFSMSQIKIPTAYLALQRLQVGYEQANDELQTLFNLCVDQCYMEKAYYPQVLSIGMKANLSFIEMFAIVDQQDWEAWIGEAGSEFTTTEYIKLGQIVERSLSTRNRIQYTAFLLIVQKYMILQESVVKDPDFLLDLEQFCESAQHYYATTYQEVMFRPENQLNLPRLCRFALRMNHAFAARKAGDYLRATAGLKEALSESPMMKDVVNGALLLLQEEREEEERLLSKERQRNEEFAMLEKQIKLKLRELISAGNKPEALQVIGQLEMLLPNDDEVQFLRRQAEGII